MDISSTSNGYAPLERLEHPVDASAVTYRNLIKSQMNRFPHHIHPSYICSGVFLTALGHFQ